MEMPKKFVFTFFAMTAINFANAVDIAPQSGFAKTRWIDVYLCAAVDERLNPNHSSAQQDVIHAIESAFIIPNRDGKKFRELAAKKIGALTTTKQLRKYEKENCPSAIVGYMGTVGYNSQ